MPAPNTNADFSTPQAWRDELERGQKASEVHWSDWDKNLQNFKGLTPDMDPSSVNVNADFTAAEVKKSQLFYETPDLIISAKGVFKEKAPAAQMPGQPPPVALPADSIIAAHREIMNDLLGNAGADVLPTVHKVILDCLVPSGMGAVKIGFNSAQKMIQAPPELMAQMGMPQDPLQPMMQPPMVPVPIDECWYVDRVPPKKIVIPADFADSNFDKSPFLGMRFRQPVNLAKQIMNLPDDFAGTTEEDKTLLKTENRQPRYTNIPYVEGWEVWYYASVFDEDEVNPKVIRRHILVDGVEGFCEKDVTNPYQEVLPTGRLSADSMIGYPIDILNIRTMPDDAYVPSDSSMIRPLVRELNTFRTQQVQERDANIPRILYDAEKILPEVIAKIEAGTVGSMIGVPADTLMNGVDRVMAQVVQGNQTRGTYVANDYIQHDLDRTLGVDSIGAGVNGQSTRTATEIGTVDKIRSIRLDHERRVILAWYLRVVQKFSAVVCRYLTPELATPLIGPSAAQAWAGWDKKTWDGRFVFSARPDSQIKLDAATERKFALDLYQFTAKDPMVNRAKLLETLFVKAGLNPQDLLVPPPPEKKPDPSVGFTFKGEDFLGPQAQQVREILAQCGIEISQEAISMSATQLYQQMTLGIRDANGKAIPPQQPQQAEHGGTVEKVRPLSQQSADHTGQRAGVKPKVQ